MRYIKSQIVESMSKHTATEPDSNMKWISTLLLERARPLTHVMFWLVVLFFYALYFGFRQDSYGQSFLFIAFLLPVTISATYFLLYWLIPRYLLRQRYFLFGLYFVYTLLFSLYLELWMLLILFISVANYKSMFVKPVLVDLLDMLVGMYLVIFLAVAINLLKRWFTIQATNSNLEKSRIEIELKLKDAELQLLRSQIQPHFLFNTLNNLYALSLERSDRVPDVILKISEQLDYMLYRGDSRKVTVEEEFGHIQNYLDIEALRYDEGRLNVSLDIQEDLQNHFISPLLLIPFVENSFKHGIRPSPKPGWIKIRLRVDSERLVFDISNSVEKPTHERTSGIGLTNVRRRLELLYPNAYALDIRNETNLFSVHLELALQSSNPETPAS